jgi:hypothetical protein
MISGKGKPKFQEKPMLLQCHFIYHKSFMDYPGIELGLPG